MTIENVLVADLSSVADRPSWPGFLPTRLADLSAQAAAARALGGDVRLMRIARFGGNEIWIGAYDAYRLEVARLDTPGESVPVRWVDVVAEVYTVLAASPAKVPADGVWLQHRYFYFADAIEKVPAFFVAKDTAKQINRGNRSVWFRDHAELERFRTLERLGTLPHPVRAS